MNRAGILVCVLFGVVALSAVALLALQSMRYESSPDTSAARDVAQSNDKGAADDPPIVKTPAFVIERPLPDADALPEFSATGAHLLIYDVQHDATTPDSPRYLRQAFKILNEAGARALGQYTVEYDPSFQTVEINHVAVIRDGVREDRRDQIDTMVAQRETMAELQILTGFKTVIMTLSDLRVGDILDIAVTVRGRHPSFDAKDAFAAPLIFGSDVAQFSLRSRWPGTVQHNAQRFTDRLAATVTSEKGETLIEIPPQAVEAISFTDADDLLQSYGFESTLIASNFGSWASVATWGKQLFAPATTDALTAVAADIRRSFEAPEERAIAALRFTQDEIRYAARIINDGGYRPQPVQQTLETRVGDCKAKVLLLLSLL
ncbi:MAG: DUF3857 domain-containing protein, partial [Pseudomonadota bacterium]